MILQFKFENEHNKKKNFCSKKIISLLQIKLNINFIVYYLSFRI